MEELPGNSYRARAQAAEKSETPTPPATNGKGPAPKEEPVVDNILVGEVVVRKKPLSKRLAETFLGGQAKDAGHYVMFDVLIPALRDLFLDSVNGGLERLVKGADPRRNVVGRPGGVIRPPYFSYNNVTRPGVGVRPDPRETISRPAQELEVPQFVFSVRSDAEGVLGQLFDRINEYNEVTLAYYKTLCRITPPYTDQSWGWTDITGVTVQRIGPDQYIINLPKLEHLPHR